MALVNHKCRKKKARYDRCVRDFYREFMAAKSMDQEEACGEKFEAYRECVLRGIKKEVWNEERWGKPGENSPLSEVDDGDEGVVVGDK